MSESESSKDSPATPPGEPGPPEAVTPPAGRPAETGARPYAPWYAQGAAWGAIGAMVVAFGVVLALVLLRPGGENGAGPEGSPSPGATAQGIAGLPEYDPVPASPCPAAAGVPQGQEGQPAGATEDGGIALGCDGVPGGPQSKAQVRVDLISDYICPYCKQFEDQVVPELIEALQAGQIQLVLHPVGYLDGYSTTGYSSRAAAAATAVAALDPTHFLAFDQALWANQPEEGGPGLDDSQIAQLALDAGVSGDVVARFGDQGFGEWVAASTATAATAPGFTGTPWVLIGTPTRSYHWTGQTGLQRAIAAVAAGDEP
jgi:protein-disulfide isomerase